MVYSDIVNSDFFKKISLLLRITVNIILGHNFTTGDRHVIHKYLINHKGMLLAHSPHCCLYPWKGGLHLITKHKIEVCEITVNVNNLESTHQTGSVYSYRNVDFPGVVYLRNFWNGRPILLGKSALR